MSDRISASGPLYRPSHDDAQGMDPGTLRILLIMGLGGLGILASVAAYSLIGHGGGGPVPVVEADSRPVRIKPENPGGMAVAEIQKPAEPGQARLAPAPEEPRPLAQVSIPAAPVPSAALMQAHPRSAVSVHLSSAKSESEAQTAWDKLAKKMPDLLSGHRPMFLKTNETGAGAWQVRTDGFADPAKAKSFCGLAKARGVVCSVVSS